MDVEKGFGQLGTIKGEHIVVTSLAWLSAEIIVAGSAEMELYFVEGGDLKAKYKAIELEAIDLSIQAEGLVFLIRFKFNKNDFSPNYIF